MTARIVVIGGGISGLSAAHRLVSEGKKSNLPLEITLLESKAQLGGVMRTERQDGYVVEHGPESFVTDKPWAYNLCHEIGLGSELIATNPANRRAAVAFRGQLRPLPEGFVMVAPTKFLPFLRSSLFSWAGKIRIGCELIIRSNRPPTDESVADFLTRRLGRELLERAGAPLIGGIYTGNAGELSANSAIPRFYELEKRYGSIIRGLLLEEQTSTASTASGARYSLFASLTLGLGSMVEALTRSLAGVRIRYNCPVVGLTLSERGHWLLRTSDGNNLEADSVIVAIPAPQASTFLADLDGALSQALSKIPFASSAVINFLFDKSDISRPLPGFGFVVSRQEKCNILAASFLSQKFVNRAPDGSVMVRVFIGGTLSPELLNCTDTQLIALALADLRLYLGLKGEAKKSWVIRWPESMPQYKVGHNQLVASIEEQVRKFDTLALAGNSYHGVGIPDCINSGELAAKAALAVCHKRGLFD